MSPPNQCAVHFRDRKVDVALVPVAAIPALDDARIVTSWCLGAVGDVRTVVLVSDAPLQQIERIYLDFHSLTSARLVRILCDELWQIAPDLEPLTDYSIIERRKSTDAFLLIGDKVFGYEGTFAHSRDLAREWRALTGLPMVFAAWVAHKNVSDEQIAGLEQALEYGVAHIPEAIEALGHGDKPYALDYLTQNMDFRFDARKQQALQRFWDYAPRVSGG